MRSSGVVGLALPVRSGGGTPTRTRSVGMLATAAGPAASSIAEVNVFAQQVAWYVAGPVLGLCVVACRVLFNARLGVTGGISNVVDELRRGRGRFDWRGCFLLGIVLG